MAHGAHGAKARRTESSSNDSRKAGGHGRGTARTADRRAHKGRGANREDAAVGEREPHPSQVTTYLNKPVTVPQKTLRLSLHYEYDRARQGWPTHSIDRGAIGNHRYRHWQPSTAAAGMALGVAAAVAGHQAWPMCGRPRVARRGDEGATARSPKPAAAGSAGALDPEGARPTVAMARP